MKSIEPTGNEFIRIDKPSKNTNTNKSATTQLTQIS